MARPAEYTEITERHTVCSVHGRSRADGAEEWFIMRQVCESEAPGALAVRMRNGDPVMGVGAESVI